MTEAELQVELENLQIQLEEENKVNKVSTSSHNYPITQLAYNWIVELNKVISRSWKGCFRHVTSTFPGPQPSFFLIA